MVDAANAESLAAAKEGLHTLLSKPQLAGIPVSLFIMLHLPDIFQTLVLGNKNDLPGAASVDSLIESL